MKNFYSIIIFSILGISLFGQVSEQKLVPDDIDPGDFFGRYLSIDNEFILIGAHQDDENGYASGSLYVFRFNDEENHFEQTQKILPDDGTIEEFFGYSIDIVGRAAVVGSHHDSDFGGSSGAAFVLTRDSNKEWSITQKLLANDPKAGDEFAKAVGMNKQWIAAGAFLDDDVATNAGSLYLFKKEGEEWIQESEIFAEDAEAHDQLGNFLSLSESHLLVGVPEKQTSGIKSGCAYIFSYDGTKWKQNAKIFPADVQERDQFGQAVSVAEGILAIGANKADSPLEDGGAVYVYKLIDDSWNLLQKIVPEDNEAGDNFGNAVFISEYYLVTGAYFDDDMGSKSGSVYFYEMINGSYQLITKIRASDGSAGDAFGSAVDLDSLHMVVGAYADSDNGFFSGSAYVIKLAELLRVKNVEFEGNILIYPSISSEFIHIECKKESLLKALTLKIISQDGSSFYKGSIKLPRESIYIGNLPDGIYYAILESGQFRQSKKFIKSKM